MTDPQRIVVTDTDDVSGEADAAAVYNGARQVEIRLEDGQTVLVDRALVHANADGHFRARLRYADLRAGLEAGTQVVLPVVEETVHVETESVESGRVRLVKTVEERDVLIDQPLQHDEVEVTRVPINAMVEAAPDIRYDGDTMIIPVLEEVVVAEVRLMVREEIHVTRRQREVHASQTVTLRREDIRVERDADATPEEGHQPEG